MFHTTHKEESIAPHADNEVVSMISHHWAEPAAAACSNLEQTKSQNISIYYLLLIGIHKIR
jgi:hypothetical protein